jgi:sugar/nucleoside kinase (ribokinase family)
VLGFLLDSGVRQAAITRGSQPVLWREEAAGGEIPVPQVEVADTLAAGDVLHGALAYALATDPRDDARFSSALKIATTVASRSCRSFGTRTWMFNVALATPPGYSAAGQL